jgi:putative Ca2+/H+ antiporter (TMEM165/GDT1 family)
MGFSLIEGFFKSIAMIVVSEIGDKTFFVAALLAMRHSRVTVFSGALGALAVMTVFSAFFGWAAPNLISRTWTHNGATVLFFLFGLKSLWDGITHEGGESAELAEVEAQLKVEGKRDDDATSRSQKSQKRGGKQQQSFLSKVLSPVFLEAFTLTFLGEWGDRSQIATIGLAAQENVTGVTLGGILGHTLCTGAAVVGGKHLASRISERTVAFCGGILFLIFGVHSLLSGAE